MLQGQSTPEFLEPGWWILWVLECMIHPGAAQIRYI